MNLNKLKSLILIFIIALCTSCYQKPLSIRGETVYKIGDNKEWSNINFDDGNWNKRITIEGGEVFWARLKFEIIKSPEPFQLYGIEFNARGEYEVFWDGIMIGKNGNPGQEETLGKSGQMWAHFSIPPELSKKGSHQIAIRKSVYHRTDAPYFGAWINDYDYLLEFPLIYTAYMHIFAGAFLLAALYFFFLFLGNKKEKPVLIFSISCFLFFALILTEFIRNYIPIHYSQHYIRMEIIAFLLFFIAILIPIYFSLQFIFPKRKQVLIAYTVILLFVFLINHNNHDQTAVNMAITMWFFLVGIISFSVNKKIKGATIVLLSLLLCAIIFNLTFFDTSLFAGFAIILLGMFYILSIKSKEQRIAYEKSLVQSTRLQLELLKKNIQPHFLMNTLTSLIDWVEESPKKGVFFIEALAKEFDLLNQIENQTLIPITQEIELCRTHLEIMKFRKEVIYLWEAKGIDDEEKIPPAIIHTLLENGITHCSPNADNKITFELMFSANNESKSYTFLTFANVRNTNKAVKDGTGIKYVKARLTESYDSKWNFLSEPTNHGWKNTITIFK